MGIDLPVEQTDDLEGWVETKGVAYPSSDPASPQKRRRMYRAGAQKNLVCTDADSVSFTATPARHRLGANDATAPT